MDWEIRLFMIAVLCNNFCAGVRLLSFDRQTSSALAEKGKKQLESLEAKTLLPQYGHCWVKSLEVLHDGCRSLTDAVHVDLALRLTGCFLEMSGQEEAPDCVSERTEALRKLCMSQMSDRAFAVYTEFFAQTQNMCFFLQSQNWHSETERTIERLSRYSKAAGEQLELVNGMQDVLMHEQTKQLNLQVELLNIGRNVSDSLNGSQQTIERLTRDLKHSTEQHSMVLEELFREFHHLHRWIVGRYAFVDGLVFYLSYVFFVLLFTSFKRTIDARGPLMVIILIGMSLEWCLQKQQTVSNTIELDSYRWIIRQTSLISSTISLFYHMYRFEDVSRQILTEIKEQNRQILEEISRNKRILPHSLNSAKVPPNPGDKKWECCWNVENNSNPVIEHKVPSIHRGIGSFSNERRSLSRTSVALIESIRESSRSTESVESHSSRYNLRRK